jgi:hypothetical protein
LSQAWLCSPVWLWTQDPPISAFQALELPACVATSSWDLSFDIHNICCLYLSPAIIVWKSILFDVDITTPALWVTVCINSFFHPFALNLFVSIRN